MYEVLASWGDVFLGGQNYDNALVQYICDEFQKEQGVDLRKDPMAYTRIVQAAEKAKIELSSSTTTDINEPYITVRDGQPLMLTMNITRAKFEQLTAEFTDKLIELTRESIKKANVDVNDIECFLMVGGSTRIPAVQEALTKTFGRPLNKSVNPDHAVAIGAGINAAQIGGVKSVKDDILLLDSTSLSYGLETEGGLMTVMIPAGTTIPVEKKECFSTAVDNQPSVTIQVLQGERPMAHDNKLIGQFNLDGIAPARRGVPQIEITFKIDASGILNVNAIDKATGKEQHITIENKPLSDDEIARIKAEAEANAEADKKKAEEIQEMNQAESMAYSLKNTLSEDKVKEKLSEDEIKLVTEKVDAVLSATSTKDIEKVRTSVNEMNEAFKPLAEKLYAQEAPTAQPTQETPTDTTSDDGVQDVPFEEV